jgi:hypothetical protein
MNELNDVLRQRFPLLSSLRISNGPGDTEDLASFMGVLLATIEESRHSSFCFVFPRKTGIGPLTAVLYSLGRFGVDFPKRAEEYARHSFQAGQRVQLYPGGKIYIFRGLWKDVESQFRLQIINEERSAFTWPVSEILRIEPTQRKIPKGRFIDADRARREAPLSALDKLIGTTTFGNTSLFENHVLYLGGRSEFDDFLRCTSLTGPRCDSPSTIDSLVPIGLIDEAGMTRHEDNYKVAGEPFIAISSRIEPVAAACAVAPPRSKLVIVDGASRITDLARFDSMIETQNMIIVAEAEDEDKLRQLYDRGCRFWRFSLADLEMGEPPRRRGRFFGAVFAAAGNEADFKTETVACDNPLLEQASVALETCQKAVDESEGDETRLILRSLYGVLMHCTSMVSPPAVAEREHLLARLAKLSDAAGNRLMWLSERAANALTEACTALKRGVEEPALGQAKGTALGELLARLREKDLRRVGIVARSATQTAALEKWLQGEGLAYPVLLPSTADEKGFFDALVCTVWPNALNFNRLVTRHAAPLIYLVAYPFERRWLHRFGQRQSQAQTVPTLKAAEKAALVGLSGDSPWPDQVKSPSPVDGPVPPEANEFPAYDFEERITRKGMTSVAEPGEEMLPATLVSFVGDAYAFLTETYRLPVITELVAGSAGEGYKVPRKRLEAIRVGDVLAFRDGGRRDVIQALADAQLGPEAPRIRETAARWHQALRASGLDEAALMKELDGVKCARTPQTVRAWLAQDSMIGPQTRQDLEAIAYAIGDENLLKAVPAIWEAIQTLRSEHLSAGMRLSRILLKKLPERIAELREGRTRIEIDNATSAWIVQADSIARQVELRPRSQINTLLWDDEYLG